jgi:hypothetical protein
MGGEEQAPAGWYADPTGRHGQRWWDGRSWTEHVADGQAVATDPAPGSPIATTSTVTTSAVTTGTASTGAAGTADQRAAIETSVREADGGRLPKGWPHRYEPVIADVLAVLEPEERVLGAWRMRTRGPRQRISDLGLLVVTDTRVVGADRSGKSAGRFVSTRSEVATVELVHRRAGGSDLGWEIHLLGADGAVLGTQDAPAELQVFAKGRDPSAWDSHPQGEEDLAAVQRALTRLLPGSTPTRGELEVTSVAQQEPVAAEPSAAPPPEAQHVPAAVEAIPAAATDISFRPSGATPTAGAVPRLHLQNGTAVRLGETVDLVLRAEPWPDPKLDHVEVTLAWRSSVLALVEPQPQTFVGMLASAPGPVMVEAAASGGGKDVTVVARGSVPAGQLDAQGRVSGSLVVPPQGPPSLEGVVEWRLSATFSRHRGMDRSESVPLTVRGLGADQLSALGSESRDGSDWLARVCDVPFQPYAARLAPLGRQQSVWVETTSDGVAPGGSVTGTITIRADSLLVAESSRPHRGAAETTGQVEVSAVRVVLECWRGSPDRETCQRMLHQETEVSGRLALARDEVRALPFEVPVPVTARLQTSHETWTADQPVPGTFRGAGIPGVLVDDIRWRVVAQVVPGGRSPHDPTPSGATWAAREVLVRD